MTPTLEAVAAGTLHPELVTSGVYGRDEIPGVLASGRARHVDTVIGASVAAALVWFAVTILNAPGQRADPGVTVIMGGVGLAILGVALIVLVLRMLLAQAVARDIEASQMRAELNEVI